MSAPTTALMPSARLDALKAHLNQWFYNPDIEALEIALSIATSHYDLTAAPVWAFIVGPSGSGKTRIIIESVAGLPDAHKMGDLTPQTFISGFAKRGHGQGFLKRLGSSGILLFKDFTTLMSKRAEARAEIAAQMRELYDGVFNKETGAGTSETWQGKVSVLAACTPAIERQWGVLRDLGERFVTVRWRREDGIISGRRALEQRFKDGSIDKTTRELAYNLVDPATLDKTPIEIPESLSEPLLHLAEMVAIARANVYRENGHGEITDIAEPESPARFAKCLAVVLNGYARMLRRTPGLEDYRLVNRVAWDSIPAQRADILSSIPIDGAATFAELTERTGIPETTLERQLENLAALKALIGEGGEGATLKRWRFTDSYTNVRKVALGPLPHISTTGVIPLRRSNL